MKFFAATLVLFTALTAVMTYPQIFHLHDAVHDDGDPLLNAWALSWVAHQLPRVPAHLFDANIFYPERRTLAFSETLIAPALVVAPLQWLGVGPLLISNLVLLSGFIVSGAGMALLVRALTGCTGPAILAGIVFAFLPYRIDHYAHLQLQQTQCLPFVFWVFHRWMASGRLGDAVLLGVFTAGQVLSCMYYGLFLVPYMAVVCGTLLIMRHRSAALHGCPAVGRPEGLRDERPPRMYTGLLVAAAITIVAAIPVASAYLGAREVVGERKRAEVVEGSATWRNYLGAPAANAVYGKAFAQFADDERRLFPGFTAIALAIVALWPRIPNPKARIAAFRDFVSSRFRDNPRWAYALGLLIALDISLGLNGLTFPLLYDHLLPFRALRIPARMGLMVGFSLAVLAGYGAARVIGGLTSIRARRTVLAGLGMLMLIEYASKPLDLQPIQTKIPQAYADLLRDRADSPDAAIVEYPNSGRDDPTYMFYSTSHFQKLVNGYSGFFPASYFQFNDAFRGFPDDQAVLAVKGRGVRYVLVHGERMIGNRYERLIARLDRHPDFALVSRSPAERYGQHGEISLYRVVYR